MRGADCCYPMTHEYLWVRSDEVEVNTFLKCRGGFEITTTWSKNALRSDKAFKPAPLMKSIVSVDQLGPRRSRTADLAFRVSGERECACTDLVYSNSRHAYMQYTLPRKSRRARGLFWFRDLSLNALINNKTCIPVFSVITLVSFNQPMFQCCLLYLLRAMFRNEFFRRVIPPYWMMS